ncbi:hypothetical protein MP228_001954 [Amoeboaphelidium protococcarum]|nr:hypothetical protein MP228_001954 [Amoeboaphelidium protococcarum]
MSGVKAKESGDNLNQLQHQQLQQQQQQQSTKLDQSAYDEVGNEMYESAMSQEDGQEAMKLPRFLRFLNWFNNWPPLARTLVYVVFGGVILMIPAVCDYLFLIEDKSVPFLDLQSNANIGGRPMMFWFIALTCTWAAYFLSSWLWLTVPVIVLRLIDLLLGKYYAQLAKPKLEYFQVLRHYLALVIASVVLNAVMEVLIIRGSRDDYKGTLASVLNCLIIGLVALAIEKFLLQSIAVGFHRTAYAERIVKAKFSDYVVERLYVAVRKRRKQGRQGGNSENSSPTQIKPFWTYVPTPAIRGSANTQANDQRAAQNISPQEESMELKYLNQAGREKRTSQ